MGDVLISNANYASERHRLKTFVNSGRDSEIPAIRYSSAGFALAAIDGSQKYHCHFCKLEVTNLHSTHDPLAWHRVYSKTCPFLKNHSQTNRQDIGIPFPDNSLSTVEFGPVILRAPQNESQMDEGEAQLFSNEHHSDQHITLVMGAGENTDAEEVPISPEELNKLYRTQCQLRSILPKQSIEVIRKPFPNIEQILSTFNYETQRRKTFNVWPKSTIVSPRELAASGFTYIHGTDDTVECFYCKLRISDWTNSMVPDVVHRKKSMNCQFMQGVKTVRNTPDVLADIFNDDALPLPSTETELGIITESTKHPEFVVDSRRKDTFLTWPSGNSKLASEMIEHQLFYTGREDVVCCFSCGVEMAGWAPTDNVWRRHARQSPECQLVIQEKGAEWVAATLQEHGRYVEPAKEPVIYSVTAEMLRSMMDNTATQNVLQMFSSEYSLEEVKAVLIQNIEYGGPDFVDRASIIRAMLKRREDARQLDAVQTAIASEPAPPEVVTPPHRPGDQEEAATRSTVQPPPATTEDPGTPYQISQPLEEEHDELAEPETLPLGSNSATLVVNSQQIQGLQLSCIICKHMQRGVALLPCGHIVSCTYCALARTQCPSCRKDISGTVTVHSDNVNGPRNKKEAAVRSNRQPTNPETPKKSCIIQKDPAEAA